MTSPGGSVQAADTEVLSAARDWLEKGQRVALVTVLRTWGSSPRPPGSLLAISADGADGAGGAVAGSVSGGCVEQELADRYRKRELGTPFPTLVDFGVDNREANRLGLPCGGRLELLVEELDAPEPVAVLLSRLERGALVARRVCLRTGEVSLHEGGDRSELEVTDDAVTKVFGPGWHLLLIGDGQLARLLARMARMLDYRVTICDPRELFADPAPLGDVEYSRLMPDDVVRKGGDDPRTAIVTLAHDPRQDDLALSEALFTKAFYIGALGSERSAAARRERLMQVGLTPSQIARLDAPAGLAIGSKRPAEIALSILAGITAARNRVSDSGQTA
jgi:xanthine dehydrogenase accessory factor